MHINTSEQGALRLGFGECSCNWGTHICGLYETDKEREELIYDFLGQGLSENDHAFHVTQHGDKEFRIEFGKAYPALASKISSHECLGTADPLGMYCPEGRFDPRKMEKSLEETFNSSQAAGPTNLRSIGDMGWATAQIPGIENLMVYESRLNYLVPGKPWVTICLYDVRKFSGSTVLNVLQTHPVTISGGVIMRNPYYIHPDAWLARYAPQFL